MSTLQTPINHRPAPMYLANSIVKPMTRFNHANKKRPTSMSFLLQFFSLIYLRENDCQTMVSNEFIYSNRERRRLKKLRKDKMRQLSSTDEPNAKHKHKHKHKCGDELCKHRKHKKRRKHKKHHHRSAVSAAVAESDQVEMPNHSNEDEDEHCDSGSGTGSVDSHEPAPVGVEKAPENRKLQNARNALTKSVNIKLNKLEWPTDDDLISSVTEDSSGSSYVSLDSLCNIFSGSCKFSNQMKSIYRILATEKAHQLRSIVELPHFCQLVSYGPGLERATNEQQEKVHEIRNCSTKPFNVEKKLFR